MNYQAPNQLQVINKNKKAIEYRPVLKSLLTRWQEGQSTFSTDVINAVMVKYQQNENWTALMAQNKFNIEQAVQVSLESTMTSQQHSVSFQKWCFGH